MPVDTCHMPGPISNLTCHKMGQWFRATQLAQVISRGFLSMVSPMVLKLGWHQKPLGGTLWFFICRFPGVGPRICPFVLVVLSRVTATAGQGATTSHTRRLEIRGEAWGVPGVNPVRPPPATRVLHRARQWHRLTKTTLVLQLCVMNQINVLSLFQELITYGKKRITPSAVLGELEDSAD